MIYPGSRSQVGDLSNDVLTTPHQGSEFLPRFKASSAYSDSTYYPLQQQFSPVMAATAFSVPRSIPKAPYSHNITDFGAIPCTYRNNRFITQLPPVLREPNSASGEEADSDKGSDGQPIHECDMIVSKESREKFSWIKVLCCRGFST